LAQISKNGYQITPLSSSHSKDLEDAQGSDLAPIFGDFSQSEKLSEIKPPLESKYMYKNIGVSQPN
jgi:hypothetical protein